MDYVLQFGEIWPYAPLIVAGAIRTAEMTAVAIVGGFLVGLLCAVCRSSPYWLLRVPATGYVQLTRNTPLLVQMYFVFFALPSLGLRLSPMTAACLTLVWNNGAYMTEILRAGLQSIPRSQYEAANCLGMHAVHVFVYVLLPPALLNVFPAIVGQCMIIFLDSSVASTIGVEDLAGTAAYIQSQTLRAFEIYSVATAVYFVLGLVIRFLLSAARPGQKWRLSLLGRLHGPLTSLPSRVLPAGKR